MNNEIFEEKVQVIEALQKAKESFSKHLEKNGLDEGFYVPEFHCWLMGSDNFPLQKISIDDFSARRIADKDFLEREKI